jgi:hypothetical protein
MKETIPGATNDYRIPNATLPLPAAQEAKANVVIQPLRDLD